MGKWINLQYKMIGRVLTTIEKQKPKHDFLMERKTLELQSLSAI
jgi:hypothetical protein